MCIKDQKNTSCMRNMDSPSVFAAWWVDIFRKGGARSKYWNCSQEQKSRSVFSLLFSERELTICRRPSVCMSVCRLSVTFMHTTQPTDIFGNVSVPFNTLVTWRHPVKILRRSSRGNPSVGGLNQRVVEKCSDFGPVQDRR